MSRQKKNLEFDWVLGTSSFCVFVNIMMKTGHRAILAPYLDSNGNEYGSSMLSAAYLQRSIMSKAISARIGYQYWSCIVDFQFRFFPVSSNHWHARIDSQAHSWQISSYSRYIADSTSFPIREIKTTWSWQTIVWPQWGDHVLSGTVISFDFFRLTDI